MQTVVVADFGDQRRFKQYTIQKFICTLEQADMTLTFAMNPEPPEDCVAILDEAVLSDCTVVVAGNVIDEGKTAFQEFLRTYGM